MERPVGGVLVVEDDRELGAELCETLRMLGYEVAAHVTSGELAIETALRDPPGVVLMDLELAGALDGIDAAARMRVPVVFLTGHASDETIARARAVGPFGFLVKPVGTTALHATIQVTLARAALEQHLTATTRLAAIGMTTHAVAHQIANPLAAAMVNLQLATSSIASLQARFGLTSDRRATEFRLPEGVEAELSELAAIVADATECAERIRGVVSDLRRLVVTDDADAPTDIGLLVDEGVAIARGLSKHLEHLERRYAPTPKVTAPAAELRRVFTHLALGIAAVVAGEPPERAPLVWVETATDLRGRAVIAFGTNVRGVTPTRESLALVGEVVAALAGELTVETPAEGHVVRIALPGVG